MGWPPRSSIAIRMPSQIIQRDLGMALAQIRVNRLLVQLARPRREPRWAFGEALFAQYASSRSTFSAFGGWAPCRVPSHQGLIVLKPRYDPRKRMPHLRDTSVEWIGLSAWRNLDAGHGTKQQV